MCLTQSSLANAQEKSVECFADPTTHFEESCDVLSRANLSSQSRKNYWGFSQTQTFLMFYPKSPETSPVLDAIVYSNICSGFVHRSNINFIAELLI